MTTIRNTAKYLVIGLYTVLVMSLPLVIMISHILFPDTFSLTKNKTEKLEYEISDTIKIKPDEMKFTFYIKENTQKQKNEMAKELSEQIRSIERNDVEIKEMKITYENENTLVTATLKNHEKAKMLITRVKYYFKYVKIDYFTDKKNEKEYINRLVSRSKEEIKPRYKDKNIKGLELLEYQKKDGFDFLSNSTEKKYKEVVIINDEEIKPTKFDEANIQILNMEENLDNLFTEKVSVKFFFRITK